LVACGRDLLSVPVDQQANAPNSVRFSQGISSKSTAIGARDQSLQVRRAAAAAGFRSLRSAAKDSIASWNKALDLIAKSAKNGESSVALRRQILRAIESSSDAEYHTKIAQLPVTVLDSL
jgi:hypothetical protein